MPTLALGSRLDNIKISLNVFIDVNVATGLALLVVYQHEDNIGVLPAQWAEVRHSQLSPLTTYHNTSSGRHGTRREYLTDINVYEKQEGLASGAATLYSLDTTVENIRDVFLPGASIPVLDYADVATPVVGGLTVTSIPTVTVFSTPVSVAESSIIQANISVSLSYIEELID
jgi:hypothetical protein